MFYIYLHISCEDLEADIMETCMEDYHVTSKDGRGHNEHLDSVCGRNEHNAMVISPHFISTEPVHYHCLSTALRRDFVVHSCVGKRTRVFHYIPTARTSSGGIVELLELPLSPLNPSL